MSKLLLGAIIFWAVFLCACTWALAQEESNGRRIYSTYCAGCHGVSGKGDGPAAKSLPVRPADHTRSAMKKFNDQYLFEIIAKGGASVGKSAQMPAWGGVVRESQIKEVVAYIRTLSEDRQQTSDRHK